MDIMNFLSIDCSTDIGSLFVKVKNKTFSQTLQSDKSNNDLLMKQILDFFNENDISFTDVSNIYVNQGPGNFSGLRGSLATAKGISLSKDLKLFGYDKFIWTYAKFLNKKKSIYSLIKFRERYFIKKFENLNKKSRIIETNKKEIIKKYNSKFLVIAKNARNNFDDEILNLDNLNTIDLKHEDLEILQLKGLLDENFIKPIYLS